MKKIGNLIFGLLALVIAVLLLVRYYQVENLSWSSGFESGVITKINHQVELDVIQLEVENGIYSLDVSLMEVEAFEAVFKELKVAFDNKDNLSFKVLPEGYYFLSKPFDGVPIGGIKSDMKVILSEDLIKKNLLELNSRLLYGVIVLFGMSFYTMFNFLKKE